MTIRSPSLVYTSGVVKGLPLFAPVVVSSSSGALTNGPLRTLPPLARNSVIRPWLNCFIAVSLNSAIGCLSLYLQSSWVTNLTLPILVRGARANQAHAPQNPHLPSAQAVGFCRKNNGRRR